MADPVFWVRMAPDPAPSSRADDRLATRVAKSPPLGIVGGILAILVMVLALAGVVPRALFLVAAIVLVVVAYGLDKRFKANAPPPAAAVPVPPTMSTPAATAPTATTPATTATSTAHAPVEADAPTLLPVGDLQAEHARLTQELTDRVDDDEDVRFEKFMRLRKIEDELARQQAAPPA